MAIFGTWRLGYIETHSLIIMRIYKNTSTTNCAVEVFLYFPTRVKVVSLKRLVSQNYTSEMRQPLTGIGLLSSRNNPEAHFYSLSP